MGKKNTPVRDSKKVNPKNKPDIEEAVKEEKTGIGKYRKKGPVRRKC